MCVPNREKVSPGTMHKAEPNSTTRSMESLRAECCERAATRPGETRPYWAFHLAEKIAYKFVVDDSSYRISARTTHQYTELITRCLDTLIKVETLMMRRLYETLLLRINYRLASIENDFLFFSHQTEEQSNDEFRYYFTEMQRDASLVSPMREISFLILCMCNLHFHFWMIQRRFFWKYFVEKSYGKYIVAFIVERISFPIKEYDTGFARVIYTLFGTQFPNTPKTMGLYVQKCSICLERLGGIANYMPGVYKFYATTDDIEESRRPDFYHRTLDDALWTIVHRGKMRQTPLDNRAASLRMMTQLDCEHTFHASCLWLWFERFKTCPVCRRDCTSRVKQSALVSAGRAPRRW